MVEIILNKISFDTSTIATYYEIVKNRIMKNINNMKTCQWSFKDNKCYEKKHTNELSYNDKIHIRQK